MLYPILSPDFARTVMLCSRCVRHRLCDAASFSISACSFSVP